MSTKSRIQKNEDVSTPVITPVSNVSTTFVSEDNQDNRLENSHQVEPTSLKSKKRAKVKADMSQSQNGNIDQVREILFGSQIRAQEESLAQLESRLELQQQKLNQTFNDRLDYIEASLKEEMHSLKQLITGEIEARSVMEKRVDNAIDQQQLEVDNNLKSLDAQVNKTITESKASIEAKLEQQETSLTAFQNKLQEELLTKLDKSESLLQTNLAEQKTFFNETLNAAIHDSTNARESLKAAMLKDLDEHAKQLQKQLTTYHSELESKLETAISEQDTKQMEKERLAQHFLDIAAKIKKS